MPFWWLPPPTETLKAASSAPNLANFSLISISPLMEGSGQDGGAAHVASEPRPKVTWQSPNHIRLLWRSVVIDSWKVLRVVGRVGTSLAWASHGHASRLTAARRARPSPGVRRAERAAPQRHGGLFLPEPERNSTTFEPLFEWIWERVWVGPESV